MTGATNQIDWGDVKAQLKKNAAAMKQALDIHPSQVQSIMHRRADRLAQRGCARPNTAEGIPVLVFHIEDKIYGIDLPNVVKVVPRLNCTPVPGLPQEFLGIANLLGEIRLILDLAAILGVNRTTKATGMTLFLRRPGAEVGLRADDIIGILPRGKDEEKSGPLAIATGATSAYLRGVTENGTILLDPQALLDLPLSGNGEADD